MKLNPSQIAKIDSHLQEALSQAREEETIRAIAILGHESGEPIDALFRAEIRPADFPSRVAYRRALIEARQKQSSAAITPTIENLQKLSLTLRGGEISETVVLEGRASEILKALEVPGLQRAMLDRVIRTPDAVQLKFREKIAALYQKILRDNGGNLWDIFRSRPSDRIEQLILQASEQYILAYQKRHNKLQILGMAKPVNLELIYTAVRVLPRNQIHYFESIEGLEEAYRQSLARSFEDWDSPRRSGIEVANKSQFLMVLGPPGGGKTTFLRKVGLEAMKLDKRKFRHSCLPVFLELKRLKGDKVDLKKAIIDQFRSCRFPEPEEFTDQALEQGRLLLLLDGLDEVPADSQDLVISEIQSLARGYNKNRFIASCRTAAYRSAFQEFSEVVIAAFDDAQIEEFIGNWFSSPADRQARTAEKCWSLLKQPEHEAAKELAQTPLLLTFLCLVYDDSQDFPKNRATLYGRALDILLEKWAAQKRLQRDAIWQGFTPELEKEMLAELAYRKFEVGYLFFPKQEITSLVEEFLAGNLNAPKNLDGETILRAIEVQQGILVERSRDIYSFSHLTLQEYLTAKYIVDNRQIKQLVGQHLFEYRWREVFLLVAGLARGKDGDELLLSMEKKARKYIVDMPKLRRLLQWADWITDGSEGEFKPVEKRAFALAIGLVLALDLARDLDRAFALDLARDLARALNRALDRALDRARVYEIEKLKVFRGISWSELTEELETLKERIPRDDQGREALLALRERLIQTWCQALHLDSDLVELSRAEAKALANYLSAIKFVMQCKEATVRVSPKIWAEIEARLLRVP